MSVPSLSPGSNAAVKQDMSLHLMASTVLVKHIGLLCLLFPLHSNLSLSPLPSTFTHEDIDECSVQNGNCTETCVNTQGSYYCTCNPGQVLLPDSHGCIRKLSLICIVSRLKGRRNLDSINN